MCKCLARGVGWAFKIKNGRLLGPFGCIPLKIFHVYVLSKVNLWNLRQFYVLDYSFLNIRLIAVKYTLQEGTDYKI
jgi:hypothetical protein